MVVVKCWGSGGSGGGGGVVGVVVEVVEEPISIFSSNIPTPIFTCTLSNSLEIKFSPSIHKRNKIHNFYKLEEVSNTYPRIPEQLSKDNSGRSCQS